METKPEHLIESLFPDQNDLIFHFKMSKRIDPLELENMEALLKRRGGRYSYLGSGRCRLWVPSTLDWLPFYQTMRSCPSVELTDVTTISERRTILLSSEA